MSVLTIKGTELRVSTDHARRMLLVRSEPGTSQSHPASLSIKTHRVQLTVPKPHVSVKEVEVLEPMAKTSGKR
jgi:hypothetical protein